MTKVIGTRSRSLRRRSSVSRMNSEFVGRPEAGRALHRADHDRAGICGELLERVLGVRGVIDMADRLGVAVAARVPRSRRRRAPGPVAITR